MFLVLGVHVDVDSHKDQKPTEKKKFFYKGPEALWKKVWRILRTEYSKNQKNLVI